MDRLVIESLAQAHPQMKASAQSMEDAKAFARAMRVALQTLSAMAPHLRELTEAEEAFAVFLENLGACRAKLTRLVDRIEMEVEKSS